MREYQRLVLIELKAKIALDIYRKEVDSEYRYGTDDLMILLNSEIEKLQ